MEIITRKISLDSGPIDILSYCKKKVSILMKIPLLDVIPDEIAAMSSYLKTHPHIYDYFVRHLKNDQPKIVLAMGELQCDKDSKFYLCRSGSNSESFALPIASQFVAGIDVFGCYFKAEIIKLEMLLV